MRARPTRPLVATVAVPYMHGCTHRSRGPADGASTLPLWRCWTREPRLRRCAVSSRTTTREATAWSGICWATSVRDCGRTAQRTTGRSGTTGCRRSRKRTANERTVLTQVSNGHRLLNVSGRVRAVTWAIISACGGSSPSSGIEVNGSGMRASGMTACSRR